MLAMSKVSDISLEEVSVLTEYILNTKVIDIGQGRGAGFDRVILLKKLCLIQKKSGIEMELFARIVKTFAIKFAIQGTRIKPDNTVIIEGKEYQADKIADLFEFRQSGKNAHQDQLTPTRMARLFATDAVEWAHDHNYKPPMCTQEDLRVTGLPDHWHFLAACYAHGADKYAAQFIALGRNFDTKMADAIGNYDKKNGFAVRMTWWFDHYIDGSLFGARFGGYSAQGAPNQEKEPEPKKDGK